MRSTNLNKTSELKLERSLNQDKLNQASYRSEILGSLDNLRRAPFAAIFQSVQENFVLLQNERREVVGGICEIRGKDR